MLKPLTAWITTNCGKFLKRWKYQATLPACWEIRAQVKKQQWEPDVKQWAGSKLGKEYVEAGYCHPTYSTSLQSSVQFSRSVVSDSLQAYGLQHTRLPHPSPTPGAYSKTHVHRVGDAIQPSHPLSSPSAFSLSYHQGLFQGVSSSHQVAKVLEFQLQYQSFQWIFRTDLL